MRKQRVKNMLAAGVGIAAVTFGMAAPAVAADRWSDIINGKDGWSSPTWYDGTAGNETRVTVHVGCTREFQARIRKHVNNAPDSTKGTEWINCYAYDDAVRSTEYIGSGTYHYDINGMDGACFCDYRTYAVADVHW